MSTLGKSLLMMAAAVLLTIGLAMVFQARLGAFVFGRLVDARAGRDITAALDDGLHIILCGTGSPLPDPTRAGPCAMVIAGKQSFLIDAGEGSARNLSAMGVSLGRLDGVFLTHFHSDHIDGLGPVMLQRWVGRAAAEPMPIHGPAGVEQIVAGFNTVYRADNGYRTAHHGAAIAPPGGAGAVAVVFALPEAGLTTVYDSGGLTIEAFAVDHSPVEPAIGYRIRYKGRSLVVSGDTAKSAAVAAAAAGADVLVHEALQPQLVRLLTDSLDARGQGNTAQITRDILNYHTSPEEAAATAAAAGVRQLVLTHIVPQVPHKLFDKAFLGDAAELFAGPITVGTDGLMISLPAGGVDVMMKELL